MVKKLVLEDLEDFKNVYSNAEFIKIKKYNEYL